jgi:hypothetical protein
MEIIVVLVVVAVALYWFAFRKRPDSYTTKEIVAEAAPYKVEAPVVAEVAPVAAEGKKATAKQKVAASRTRKGGKFVGDDKSTPNVNEAFKEGKAPAKTKAKKQTFAKKAAKPAA